MNYYSPKMNNMNEDYFLYTRGATVPKTVTRVRIHHSVEHIPDDAFMYCFDLVEVELHDGLRTIGQCAFLSCRSLLRIIIPSSVISIGNDAFFNCTALVEVKLYEGLRRIGAYAFWHCISLLRINIPSSVISIGNEAFLKCSAMVEVNLHEGLQEIGDEAFRQCSSLLRIIIPSSVASIGNGAFKYCQALVQVELYEGLSSIGQEAFYNCISLLRIIIPSSTISIGNDAFARCNLLRNAAIPSTSAITQEQFASSFHTLCCSDITLDLIKGRFDGLSLHRLCNNYNPAPGTQAEVQSQCESFIQAVNQHSVLEFQRRDCLGMTPLHVILCSGKYNGMRVIQCMVEKCPDALLIQDKWGKVPLDYALLGKASIAIIDLLFATHSKRWEALPFDFGVTIFERLAWMHKHAQFVRDVIRVQRTHFPSLVVDWQHLAYAINPETITRIPIGTFRVFVEASLSVRRYNCMSEEHRIEVDARIHEIEEDNDHDELEEEDVIHYFGEIRDMVTRFVQLHHALLQEAGNTLVHAGMPKDAVKQVLSFL
jgi:hypothetical protein